MHLYAEATLAIVETLHKEIQFKQIMGDFQTLQGKIMLQQDGPEKVKHSGFDVGVLVLHRLEGIGSKHTSAKCP